MLTNGSLVTTEHYFYCPIFNVWFINVWWVQGTGIFRTSDTDNDVFFQNLFPITLPNTEDKCVSASIFMWVNLTAEYCELDPSDLLNPERIVWYEEPEIMEEGEWVFTGVFWNASIPIDIRFGMVYCQVVPCLIWINKNNFYFIYIKMFFTKIKLIGVFVLYLLIDFYIGIIRNLSED